MVVREKNCYYAIALTDFFVFLSCAEAFLLNFYAANNKKKRQQSHLFFKVNYQLSS